MSSLLTNFTDSKIAAEASSAVGVSTSGGDARLSDPNVVVRTISGGRRRRNSLKKSKKAKKSKARKSNKKRRSYRRPLFLL